MANKTYEQCYATLGLVFGTDQDTVHRTWRGLAKKLHPQQYRNDPAAAKRAEDQLKEINVAYEQLKRWFFDNPGVTPPQAVKPQQAPPQPNPNPQGGTTYRNPRQEDFWYGAFDEDLYPDGRRKPRTQAQQEEVNLRARRRWHEKAGLGVVLASMAVLSWFFGVVGGVLSAALGFSMYAFYMLVVRTVLHNRGYDSRDIKRATASTVNFVLCGAMTLTGLCHPILGWFLTPAIMAALLACFMGVRYWRTTADYYTSNRVKDTFSWDDDSWLAAAAIGIPLAVIIYCMNAQLAWLVACIIVFGIGGAIAMYLDDKFIVDLGKHGWLATAAISLPVAILAVVTLDFYFMIGGAAVMLFACAAAWKWLDSVQWQRYGG